MRARLFSRQVTLTVTSIRTMASLNKGYIFPDDPADYKKNTAAILKDFYEVSASFVNVFPQDRLEKGSSAYKVYHEGWRINIMLNPPDNSVPNPNDELFTEKYLQKFSVTRHPETSIFCRGDDRTIHQIREEGKIRPKGEYQSVPAVCDPYDVAYHRMSSSYSYFVSLTKKMVIAHDIGQQDYGAQKYTVYLVKAADTLGPHIVSHGKDYSYALLKEEEFSKLHGVKYEDIVGFRECDKIKLPESYKFAHHCGSIFVSKAFVRDHQEYVNDVIELQHFPEEERKPHQFKN